MAERLTKMAKYGTDYIKIKMDKAECDSEPSIKCGVYCIYNDYTKSVYVGQSKNIEKRVKEHFACLKRNQYSKQYPVFQNDYNESSCNFAWKILDICDTENLLKFETEWLMHYNSIGYMVYNRLLETKDITGCFIPSKYSNIIERVVYMLDRGIITEDGLDKLLK